MKCHMADGEEACDSLLPLNHLRTSTSPVSVGIAVTSGNSAMTGESAIRRSGLPYFNQPPTPAIFTDLQKKYTKRKPKVWSFNIANIY